MEENKEIVEGQNSVVVNQSDNVVVEQNNVVQQTQVVAEQSVSIVKDKKKSKRPKSTVGKILDSLISIVVFGILAAWLFDFYNFYSNKPPKLCIKKEVIEYEDGVTELCIGAGYKIFEYKRESIQGMEFGGFWLEERL